MKEVTSSFLTLEILRWLEFFFPSSFHVRTFLSWRSKTCVSAAGEAAASGPSGGSVNLSKLASPAAHRDCHSLCSLYPLQCSLYPVMLRLFCVPWTVSRSFILSCVPWAVSHSFYSVLCSVHSVVEHLLSCVPCILSSVEIRLAGRGVSAILCIVIGCIGGVTP